MQEKCRALVARLDNQDLLKGGVPVAAVQSDEMDDDALLAELGVEADALPIIKLKNARSSSEKKAAEEIANRQRCEECETFKPLFEIEKKKLDSSFR